MKIGKHILNVDAYVAIRLISGFFGYHGASFPI